MDVWVRCTYCYFRCIYYVEGDFQRIDIEMLILTGRSHLFPGASLSTDEFHADNNDCMLQIPKLSPDSRSFTA